jgi:hypothetical protein
VQINNAGVLNNNETLETATVTLQTNYYGVKNVTKALLSVLRPGARVVMVSSGLGQLKVCFLSFFLSIFLTPSLLTFVSLMFLTKKFLKVYNLSL